MQRFTGLLGIMVIFAIAYLMSNNRKAISARVVGFGFGLQWLLALFILKVPLGKEIFHQIGLGVARMLDFAMVGANFVFGKLADADTLEKVLGPGNGFIFVISVTVTVIFVCALANMLYYLGIMQRVISVIAKGVTKLMHISGVEAFSNVASAFLGQVEAQIMIGPYVEGMTMSELLASMTGSMATIAGSMLIVYVSLGVPAEYLLAANIMAIPGALAISKIVYPETQLGQSQREVNLVIPHKEHNLIDAIAQGCAGGVKIAVNIMAMLIGFLAIIALIDWGIGKIDVLLSFLGVDLSFIGIDIKSINLSSLLGLIFAPMAFLMGVPIHDILHVGSLLGTKVATNEFVAYTQLLTILQHKVTATLSQKSIVIASFALCGFANFSSIAIQIGGIGAIAPKRRHHLAELGMRALICGTLASYMSATIAGIIIG